MRDRPDRPPVVAIVSDAIYPYNKGGKELRYHEITSRLADAGWDVNVYTMHWWDGPRERVENGITYRALCRRQGLYSGGRRSIFQALAFSLGCLRLLGRDFDIIEADHMPYLQLFPLWFVARCKRRELVVTWHEVWGLRGWREYLGVLGFVAAAIEYVSMRLPDHIVTAHPETGRRLQAAGVRADRLDVVPNGVDLPMIESAVPSEERFDLIFVGRLLAHKNVDLVLDALRILRDEGTTLSCAVVGEGPERDELDRQVDRLGLTDQVRFLGRIEDSAGVWGLMKSSGALVLPSAREGFGIVVIEALACGVPVITVEHPDNQARHLVDHGVTGWICDLTAADLAKAIREMMDRPPDLSSVQEEKLSDYNWDTIARSVAGVYRDRARKKLA
jgi:glycosyltransferase involved in cell wall biosynthesis